MKVGGAEVGSGWAVFIGGLLIDCSIDNTQFTWGYTSCKQSPCHVPARKGQTAERLILCRKKGSPLQAWPPGLGDDPGSGCVR
jgi:hypothetical protein